MAESTSVESHQTEKTAQAPSGAPSTPVEGPDADTAIVLTGVTKTFPGVRALSDVHFDARPGEVHALVGENGSGKSTMIKVASGVLTPDSGEVLIAGQALAGGNARRSRELGLFTAYQDTSLVEELSVADNIALSFNAMGQPRPADLDKILARYELPFGPSDSVASLGPGGRQLLEVARAMAHRPRVLILDEPTAALDMRLAAHLEELIKQSRDEGVAVIYVSHRLEEIRRLADRVTVLRDGVIQGTHASRDWNVDEIVELMVGAPTELEFPTRSASPTSSKRLAVHDFTGAGYGPVSLTVHAGEIVGMAGAEGNGQRAVLRDLIGMGRAGGRITIDGHELGRVTPASALQAGISFQSGDRAAESVYEPLSVMDNATTQLGSAAGPAGLVLSRHLRGAYQQVRDGLGIVAASPYQPISALSGGNQQKAVLARPALRKPKVLIVDEPTQGVDARARLDIYRVLAEAAEEGTAVLVNSSDSAELAGLCDRVYVMSRGKVVNELSRPLAENEIVRSFVSAMSAGEGTSTHVTAATGFFRRAMDKLSGHIPIAVLGTLIMIVSLYTGAHSDVFWTRPNLANLLLLSLPLAVIALGQQVAMLSGGLDISVGSTVSLTVVVISMLLPDLGAVSVFATALALLVLALAIGFFNAFLVQGLKVNAIVATVATMGIVQGIAIVIRPEPGGVIAPELGTAFAMGIGFVPGPFAVVAVVAISLEFWLYQRRGGLALRGIGFNAEASRRIGQPVATICSGAMVVCALGAVIGGLCLASQSGIGSNAVGAGYTLPVFAAVFLGGAVLTGGRGSFVGAVLGAVFLSLLNNVTPLLNIPDATKQTLYGAILLIAVATYAATQRGGFRRSGG
jgi:ribose transport system ATP-binding protein